MSVILSSCIREAKNDRSFVYYQVRKYKLLNLINTFLICLFFIFIGSHLRREICKFCHVVHTVFPHEALHMRHNLKYYIKQAVLTSIKYDKIIFNIILQYLYLHRKTDEYRP